MKNNLIFNFEYQFERISSIQGVFSIDLMTSTNFFAHPVKKKKPHPFVG